MLRNIILYLVLLSFTQQIICFFGFFNKPDIKIVRGSCSTNENFAKCGSDCGRTCDDIFTKGVNCSINCTEGCFCEIGFFRDFGQKGRCVRPFECHSFKTKLLISDYKQMCAKNQEYKCGSDCGQSCEDIGKTVKCPSTCDSGCYCANGYYRDGNANGQCIKEKHCKKNKEKKANSKRKEFLTWFKKHFPWKM